jgi:hypothetical protein
MPDPFATVYGTEWFIDTDAGLVITDKGVFPLEAVGDLTLSGVLFSKPPAFISGVVAGPITGVLFSKPPSFISGVVLSGSIVTGVLFSKPPSFISGAVNLTISGILFSKPPSFISGVVAGPVTGVLFSKPPTFITGTITQVGIFSGWGIPAGI